MDNFNHIGNQNLREVITAKVSEFSLNERKLYRSDVVSNIVEQVHKNGGAFIKKDKEKGLWYNAENHLARGKVFQLFRSIMKQNNSEEDCSNNMSNSQQENAEMVIKNNNGNNLNTESNILSPYGIGANNSQNDTFSALLQLRYGSNDNSSLRSNTPSNAQVKKTQTKKKTTRKGKVDIL